MSMMTPTRFEMRRLTENEWLILDDSFDRTDARHTVACVSRVSAEQVEVVWLRPVAERIRYASVADVLEAVSSAPSHQPLAGGPT
ncbi:hypothetical protein [Microbacterium sp. 13-71-7]|jgi:uncharacterized protein with von Willebrand factor type A (vWA) domain|uniref:hypothetical protein n=1 Tax=Microbacterium sp. 13-71-7 TaxID=1970399 RepID=UPI000BCE4B21|nr:hypothetical protein [Microbacterium sp. 13-71-7]OZB81598.1 MAG: hypothetical protein B7X32_16305 [Microbacterium sp. 13-71-7]